LVFIHSFAKTVWDIELLIYLWRMRERAWSHQELVRELRASETVIRLGLSNLADARLVDLREDGTCRYSPPSPKLDAQVEALAQLFRDKPVSVINAATSPSRRKVQGLANAFRIKKD
jgi:hypothetical protein